jgi:hypothetical protein
LSSMRVERFEPSGGSANAGVRRPLTVAPASGPAPVPSGEHVARVAPLRLGGDGVRRWGGAAIVRWVRQVFSFKGSHPSQPAPHADLLAVIDRGGATDMVLCRADSERAFLMPQEDSESALLTAAGKLTELEALGFPVVKLHRLTAEGLLMGVPEGAVSSKASTRQLLKVLDLKSQHQFEAIACRLTEHAPGKVGKLEYLLAKGGVVLICLTSALETPTSHAENLQEIRRLQALCFFRPTGSFSNVDYYQRRDDPSRTVALAGHSMEELLEQIAANQELEACGKFPLVKVYGLCEVGDEYGLVMQTVHRAVSSRDMNVGKRMTDRTAQGLRNILQALREEGIHLDGPGGMELFFDLHGQPLVVPVARVYQRETYSEENVREIVRLLEKYAVQTRPDTVRGRNRGKA